MTLKSDANPTPTDVRTALLAWWDAGHADLPWRATRDPYRVWIAEVMAQQTQLATMLPYYQRWLARFPTVASLAAASLDEVLTLWAGLGYYSRARNLHAAARRVVAEMGGELPRSAAGLRQLPGIGPYTAGAIASICYEEPAPLVDGNVTRVLARLFDLTGDVTRGPVKKELWRLAGELVDPVRPGDFNQTLMELGQRICTPAQPRCVDCPLGHLCLARARGTQLERPVRPPRAQIPHVDVVAGVIWRAEVGNGPFLITQRPLDGLLGGLWEFPGGKVEPGESAGEALVREIQEEMAIDIAVIKEAPLVTVRHAYTHFKITLRALHAGFLSGEVRHLGVRDHAWVTPNDLDGYAFAATDRQIIAALHEWLNGQMK